MTFFTSKIKEPGKQRCHGLPILSKNASEWDQTRSNSAFESKIKFKINQDVRLSPIFSLAFLIISLIYRNSIEEWLVTDLYFSIYGGKIGSHPCFRRPGLKNTLI